MCGVCLLVREVVSGQTCHTVCLSRALGTCYSHVSGCVMLPNTLHIPDRDDHHATHTSNNLQASRCYSYSTAGTCSCGSASSRRPNKMGPSFRHTTFATVGRRYFSRYTAGDMPPTARTIPPWRTLFFGTDWFATQHLKMLNLNRSVDHLHFCNQYLTHFILKLVQTSCSQFLIISSNQSVNIKNDRPSFKMDITLLFLNQFLNVIYL